MTKALEIGAVSRLRVTVEAGPSAPRFLSDLVQAWLTHALGLDADGSDTVRVRLALVEGMTNVVRHAYDGRVPGPLTLTVWTEGEDLVARIEDEGREFEPRAGYCGLPRPEELRETGYGLGIMREVMDEVTFQRDDDRVNRLNLRKRLWT